MKKVHVAIIDGDLNLDHTLFKGVKLYIDRFPKENEECIDEIDKGHGTAIYNIINLNKQCDIKHFVLSGIENGVDAKNLVEILEYIYNSYPEINIINLSLGVSFIEDDGRLYEVCKKLYTRGVILVSAFDNSGCVSYPASYDCVIGVVSEPICSSINDFAIYEKSIINIGGKGSNQRVAWSNPEYIMMSGNSFACAHVTVQVIKFFDLGINTFSKILRAFSKISKNRYLAETSRKETRRKKRPDITKYHNVAVFPFNKEMHSLVRFNSMLSFSIIGVYDFVYSGRVGASTNHLLSINSTNNYVIQNIEDIDFSNIDTLIIGHMGAYQSIFDISISLKKLLEKANQKEINIFSFDNLKTIYSQLLSDERYYYPYINKEDVKSNQKGMLYRIAKPVIGVFGTSSQQGKFTLQLELRKRFLNDGYNVSQLGTEPNSYLFNFNSCYPMGFGCTVSIKENSAVMYLNSEMKRITSPEIDVVIVGSQSGTVPYDYANTILLNFSQYSFLLGTQPDVIVLCVNPYDEVEYVRRTINFLEASISTKVLGLVMFPMTYINDWAILSHTKTKISDQDATNKKSQFESIIKLPIYSLEKENDIDKLYGLLIEEFS